MMTMTQANSASYPLRPVAGHRRPAVHRVHSQPGPDQRRPLLFHHEAGQLRPVPDSAARDGHDRRRLDPVGGHLLPAARRMDETAASTRRRPRSVRP